MCKVPGRRWHFEDLALGRLEIPCIEGCVKHITKVEKLIKKSMVTPIQQEETPTDIN